MLKVGLTGGLASGKTLVGEALVSSGCLLIQADELGHEALAPGGAAYDAVVREFGREILTGGAPSTANISARWCSLARAAGPAQCAGASGSGAARGGLIAEFARARSAGIAVVEAAILIETGSYKRFDRIILVWCAVEQQVERALPRGGAEEGDVRARISRQMPLAQNGSLPISS